jgi:predicted metal-binding membrane protein
MVTERASQRAFFGVSALLFAASAAVTIVWCASMSAMAEMPMPGGWTMSMAWTRMPGQTWPGAAASFLGMWVVMMVAMMLPSLVPMLWRYRQAVGRTGETRLGRLTALVGVGYFFVWTVFGMAAFPLGVALAAVEMQLPALARAVPIAVGVVVLIAGSLQLTAWKARHLACCRVAPGRGRTLPADAGTAWRHGLRLGLHCSYCCAGLTAILLVVGVMDLRTMAVVAAAITVERLAPAGERVARAIGAVVVGAGLFLIALFLFACNGAIADVAAVLHQVPVNRVHEVVRLSLRGGDGIAQTDRAEYAPAGGDDLRAFPAGAGVKDFSGQPCRGIETADRITLTVTVGVAAGRHHDAERRARVPAGTGSVQRAGERRLA